MNKVLFTETQKFDQWWLKALVMVTGLALGGSMVSLLINTSPGFWGGFLIGLAFAVSFLLIFSVFVMRLETSINEKEIYIHFYPFIKRRCLWSEVKSAKVFDYGFVGGWGIRLWTGYGTVYNIKGSKGLHIKTDSKEFVIGTQKEEELRSSIAHLLK